MEALRDGLARTDLSGRIQEFNEAFRAMVGYGREELLALTYLDLTPPKWHAVESAILQDQVMTRGYSDVYEKEYVHADGSVFPVELRTILERDEGGAPVSFWAVVRDISERKRADAALRRSEEIMGYIIKYDPSAMAVFDRDLRYIAVSDSYLTDYGVAGRDVLGKHHYEVFPEMPQAWREVHQRVLAGAVEREENDIFVRPDGSVTYKRWECRPWYEPDGSIGGMIVYTEETTEAKRAEQALRESERMLATLMANLPGMAYRCRNDREWSMLFLSEGGEKLTGYKAVELVDNARVSYSDLVHPEDREMVWQEIQTRVAARESFRLVYRIVTAGGDTKWVWEQGQGVFDDDSLLHLEGFITDISERVGAEQALRMAEEQLRQSQKMEAVGQLAGGIAHDFNNLLTAIIGYCELLLSDPETEGLPLRDDVAEIKRAGERASSLTRQILAFSRRQTLRPRVVSLNEVLVGMEPLLRRTLGEDIEFICLEHSELGLVEVDVHQFEQVLMNLAVNARDAMPTGGRLTLEIANVELGEDHCRSHPDAEPGSYVMLSVSDTGSGMDPAITAHIFEPFFTTKGPGRGTGLGLSTVYGIVRQSGGSINVFSAPGEGTSFKVYLPRVADPESTAAPAASTTSSVLGDSARRSPG